MNESLQEELKLLGLTDARLVEDVKGKKFKNRIKWIYMTQLEMLKRI